MATTMNTPWGPSQTVKKIAPGIQFITTASHGGFKLSPQKNKEIPSYMRHSDGWYEEDVDWAIVVTSFPKEFPVKELRFAHDTLKKWHPESYEKFFREDLPEGSSPVRELERFRKLHVNDYLVMAAWGDWHKDVPYGFVGVFAGRGGRKKIGQYPEDTAYFLIPAWEYEERSDPEFVVDPERHEAILPFS